MQTILGQPPVGSPKIKVLTMIIIIIIKEIKQNNIPIIEAIESGTVEKATILSNEYKNNLKNDHLVVPAALSIFSYSSHFVRQPKKISL